MSRGCKTLLYSKPTCFLFTEIILGELAHTPPPAVEAEEVAMIS